MTTTAHHTAKCIENALASIENNNLDTLVERGINERIAEQGLDWLGANKLIDAELQAGYEAHTLCRPTEENAAEWLADGTFVCSEYSACWDGE